MKKIILILVVLLGPLAHAQNDCVSKKFDASYQEMLQAKEAYETKAQKGKIDPFDVALPTVTSTYLTAAQNASNLLEFCLVMNSHTYGDSTEAQTLLWKKFDKDIENIFSNISIHYIIVPFDSLTIEKGALRMNITCKKNVQEMTFEELCVLAGTIIGFHNNDRPEPMTKETLVLYQTCAKQLKELAKLSSCPDKKIAAELIPVSLK